MFSAILLMMLQAGAVAPDAPPAMNSAQRRVVEAMGPWMQCLLVPLADVTFPNPTAADAAGDRALAACRNEENSLKAALNAGLPRRRAQAVLADLRNQFRTQLRQGGIRRTPAASTSTN